MAVLFEVCSFCGLHGRVSLRGLFTKLNLACKEHVLHFVHNTAPHTQLTHEEVRAFTETVQNSSIPEIKHASNHLLWATHVANLADLALSPEIMCDLFKNSGTAHVLEDFRNAVDFTALSYNKSV